MPTYWPTEAEILAIRSPRGGWSRQQLVDWGVPWPPRAGWRWALIERNESFFEARCRPPAGPEIAFRLARRTRVHSSRISDERVGTGRTQRSLGLR
jgi:hypothetical protein